MFLHEAHNHIQAAQQVVFQKNAHVLTLIQTYMHNLKDPQIK